MNKLNTRKILIFNIAMVALIPVAVVFQNFSENPASISDTTKKESSIENSLTAALQSAEKDHVAKQVALQVEPNQVEQRIKKTRGPSNIVELKADTATDTDESARAIVSPNSATEEEVLDVENAMPGNE